MPSPANASDTYKQQIREIAVGTKGTVDSSMVFDTEESATAIQPAAIAMTIQAVSDGSHSGTSSIDVEGSNDGTNYITLATLSVTGASDADGIALDIAAWENIRGTCTSHGDDTNNVTLYIAY